MIQSLSSTAAPAAKPDVSLKENRRAELAEAAKAFEAVFVRQMIGSMRSASLGDDLFGSSAADQFRDMQDAKLADEMADDGSFGIGDMLLRQFDRQGITK